jgi:hypothetical protein
LKRIKFKEFSLNWYSIISLIFAVALIMFGSGIFLDYINFVLVFFGFLIILFYLSRFFWYKNYVKYNSKSVFIRINTFLGKSFKFDDIKKVKVTSSEMIITTNSINHIIDLHKIDRNDIDDMADILIDNSKAEYTSEVMHEKFYKKP